MKPKSMTNKAAIQVSEKNQLGRENVIKPRQSIKLTIRTFLLVSLFLTAHVQNLQAQVSFNTAVSISVGTNPRGLTVADVNLDGNPDLLAANYNSNDVSVRLGNGLGGFSGTTSISVGTNPRGLTVADINLDGKPDLLVANENSNSVSVRLGDGIGGFSGTTEITVQTNPLGVVAADINLDGKPDLLANNYNSNTVSVRLGDGLGGFTGSTNVSVGNAPISLTVADVNLDGNPDILVSRIGAGNNAVSVRLGDGLGGFTGTTNILVGSFPYKVVVADLNIDGKPDFLTSNLGANTVSVRLGDGVGGFSGSTEITVGSGPISIAVGDVNSDSKPDFVVANRFGNNITVGLGDGVGAFNTAPALAVGSDPWAIVLGDVNVDGKPDVLTANQNSNDVSILLNTTSNTPAIASFTPTSGPIGTTVTITGTNFSATPANNIVFFGATRATVTAATTNQLTVTVPTGATYQPITVQVAGLTAYSSKRFFPTFTGGGSIDVCSFDRKDFAAGLNPLGMMIKDFDGDGKGDIAITEVFSYQLSIYKNTSTIGVIDASTLSTPVSLATLPINPWSVSSGDIDGDGKPDLVIANSLGFSISIYRNTSTPGTISFEPKVDFAAGVAPWRTAIIDIDGDGKPEIVVSNRFSNSVAVYKNTSSTGSFSATTLASPVSFSTGTEPFDVSVGDLNGDDKPDIVALNNVSNTVSVFQNTTTPGVINSSSFSAKVDFPLGGTPYGLALADIDGDTKLDILATNSIANSTISILQNVSGGTINASSFSPKVDFSVGLTPAHFGLADFNGDGKLDLAVSNSSSNTLTLLRNTATMGSITSASLAAGVNISSLLNPGGIAAGDIDGDGRPEIVAGNFLSGSLSIYQNLVGLINPPTIASFAPLSGAIGTSVTITGTNFSTPFSNTVKINGITATITSSTATSLTVTIPAGATTGPFAVTIGCNTVASASSFIVPVPPTITNFIPTSGPIGTTVTITGTNFDSTPANNTVSFNGTTAVVTASTPTTITTTVPTGATTGTITVTVASNTATSTTNFTVTTCPASPSVVPSSGCNGTAITLTASGGTPGQYRWYSVATSGTAISGQVNSTYITPPLTTTTSYFVSINDGACESSRTEVIATVISLPTAPGVQAVGPVCPGSTVTLTATGGTAGQYRWYDGATLLGSINSTYTATNLSITKTFQVAINNGTCESNKTAVTATVQNCTPPAVANTTATAFIEGIVTIDLEKLITDTENNIDPTRLQITQQPASGAPAFLNQFLLTINYTGFPFTGSDRVGIEACDLTNLCTAQVITIELGGDITVYNALSPNGDGKNETFFIQYIDILPETQSNKVFIYNRWGDEVFTVNDYNNADRVFKGDNKNGNKLPTGTYFYKIMLPKAGKTMTGFISLKY
ncbi:MAG: FG-GAP-like repeat-containing protein [Cyclobacteriaceae bacterium]|nr:FG-GAP-like repeat-containing protein [Cyclobacteriaceae bacterium]